MLMYYIYTHSYMYVIDIQPYMYILYIYIYDELFSFFYTHSLSNLLANYYSHYF